MSDEPFKSLVEQVNRPMRTEERVCVVDEAYVAITVKERVVRCRDCEHSRKDGALCMFFASWEPIAGGDEYAEMPADVEPYGFCAWGERRSG
jgi:hypothetical protein